jgi:NADPH:quinone reductase-like Zn-dependent oxidoreductase
MKASGNQLDQITGLLKEGRIKPVIDKEFSFDQSQEAMDYLESGRARGKVIVRNWR